MVKRITEYTLYLLAKSKIFWLEFTLINGITVYMLFLQNDLYFPGIAKALMLKVVFQFIGLLVPAFIIGIFAEALIQMFLIEERLKWRFEYLMANRLFIKPIWIGTSLGFSIAGLFTLFSVYGILLLGIYIRNGSIPFVKNLLILWFAVFPLLLISLLFFLSALGFVVRRAKLFETIIMASLFLFFFGGVYLFKHILLQSNVVSGVIITPHILFVFVLVAALFAIITLAVAKLLTPDNVTLSVPD